MYVCGWMDGWTHGLDYLSRSGSQIIVGLVVKVATQTAHFVHMLWFQNYIDTQSLVPFNNDT